MRKVAVVILNYNGKKLLPQFLPSVINFSKQARIVVADNASTDQSSTLLKKDFPQVELIQLDKNYGFCGGYNRALKDIQEDYVVLLNSDVEVTANWLDPLIKLLDENSTVAAVQPKILSYTQRELFEYAGAGGGFIDSLGYPFCRGRLFNHLENDNGQYNDTREVFWASGACMIIRTSVYKELGGLDEDFFAHMEEIDLCWRIQRSGNKVMYCGSSTVYHLGGGTLSKSNPRKTFYNFRNGLSLLFKNLSTGTLILKLPLRLILDYIAAFQFLMAGKSGDSLAVLKAHGSFLASWNRNSKKRQHLKKYPFTKENVFHGLTVAQYFILGKKSIEI